MYFPEFITLLPTIYTAGGSSSDISIKGLSKEDADRWKEFVSEKIKTKTIDFVKIKSYYY